MSNFPQKPLDDVLRQVEHAALNLAHACNMARSGLQEQVFGDAQAELRKFFFPTNGFYPQTAGFRFPGPVANAFLPVAPPRSAPQIFPVEQAEIEPTIKPAPAPAVTAQPAKANSVKVELSQLEAFIKAGPKKTADILAHFNIHNYVMRGLAAKSNHLKFENNCWHYSEQAIVKPPHRTETDLRNKIDELDRGVGVLSVLLEKQLNCPPGIIKKLAIKAGCVTSDNGKTWRNATKKD